MVMVTVGGIAQAVVDVIEAYMQRFPQMTEDVGGIHFKTPGTIQTQQSSFSPQQSTIKGFIFKINAVQWVR